MLYALSFAALAAAQSSSTTVSLLFPNVDTQNNLVGSIVGSDATATTYVVGCAAAASTAAAASSINPDASVIGDIGDGCGFPASQTVTQGPSTYHWILSEAEMYVSSNVPRSLSQIHG